MFPVLWIVSLSLDPRNLSRPDGLNLIPPGATLEAYAKVLAQPTSNPISFLELALNSFIIAVGDGADLGAHRRDRGVCVLAPASSAAARS